MLKKLFSQFWELSVLLASRKACGRAAEDPQKTLAEEIHLAVHHYQNISFQLIALDAKSRQEQLQSLLNELQIKLSPIKLVRAEAHPVGGQAGSILDLQGKLSLPALQRDQSIPHVLTRPQMQIVEDALE